MNGQVVRLAAIGCGRVFERYHLPAIRASAEVQLVGACEVDERRLAWARSAMPEVTVGQDVEGFLRTDVADAALITTPPSTHAAIAGAALRAGWHVLVEKPMALTGHDAEQLAAEQRAAGRVLCVGFNRRYRAAYARMRQRIQREGGIRSISFRFIADGLRWNPHRGGATPEFVLHDAGSHAVDLIRYVADSPIEQVRAEAQNATGECMVRIEARLAGGIVATSLVGQAARYEENLSVTDARRTHRVDVSGRTVAGRLITAAQLAGRKLTARPTPTDDSFRRQLAGFVSACRGREDGTGARVTEGCASVAAIDACLSSLADAGVWCDVEQARPTIGNLEK